jgi:hypothetical protein
MLFAEQKAHRFLLDAGLEPSAPNLAKCFAFDS